MNNHEEFTSEDPLHITSSTQQQSKRLHRSSKVGSTSLVRVWNSNQQLLKDQVQLDKRNSANTFITKWWLPETTIEQGITKIFEEMKNDYLVQ